MTTKTQQHCVNGLHQLQYTLYWCVCVCVHWLCRSRLYSHLEEALHILQNVDSTVTEVVLLRHMWARTLCLVPPKTPPTSFPHLPLHLQVPAVTHASHINKNTKKKNGLGRFALVRQCV